MEIDPIRKHIGTEMSRYFKSHGITHKEVAEALNLAEQTIHNHIQGVPIGSKTRDAYFLTYGFEPEFLKSGKGTLVKKTSGYQKVVQENQQLKALVKAQRLIIEKYRKQENISRIQSE